jgi:hypothetical protein
VEPYGALPRKCYYYYYFKGIQDKMVQREDGFTEKVKG